MREIARALLLVCLSFDAVPALASPEAVVTPLFAKDLPELQGKEGVMILVEYPPGATDPIHRHNAHAFVYVLEGSIVMQLRDAAEVTLSPGQTYTRDPTTFTSWAGMQAARGPPSLSCSSSRTRAPRSSNQSSKPKATRRRP